LRYPVAAGLWPQKGCCPARQDFFLLAYGSLPDPCLARLISNLLKRTSGGNTLAIEVVLT